ncbi:hypothetical protein K6U20_11855 [Vibrio fluvialis]|nr:hypothetical protein [Vibrio fluvialis]MCG6405317.1 hypothetical protein [Vibrio fluvialis]
MTNIFMNLAHDTFYLVALYVLVTLCIATYSKARAAVWRHNAPNHTIHQLKKWIDLDDAYIVDSLYKAIDRRAAAPLGVAELVLLFWTGKQRPQQAHLDTLVAFLLCNRQEQQQ